MKSHADFSGEYILVEAITDNTIIMKPYQRDTMIPCFYWCFCIGCYGAGVNADMADW